MADEKNRQQGQGSERNPQTGSQSEQPRQPQQGQPGKEQQGGQKSGQQVASRTLARIGNDRKTNEDPQAGLFFLERFDPR